MFINCRSLCHELQWKLSFQESNRLLVCNIESLFFLLHQKSMAYLQIHIAVSFSSKLDNKKMPSILETLHRIYKQVVVYDKLCRNQGKNKNIYINKSLQTRY